MISMYKWSRIKSMRARGKSIRMIAKELGISRNTVRRYVRQGGPPRYEKSAKECKRVTEGFEERVKELLKGEYIGTEIFERLKGEGYRGSLSSIYRLIKAVREDEEKGIKVTSRFETAPGEQMQYDWKEWNLVVKGKTLKVYIHQLILGYSRKKFFTFSVSIKTGDVIRAIREGLKYFGGVANELVIDNGKQMVILHKEKGGVVRFNDDFLKFCGYYGIEVKACRPYRARTKGKVERPFYYLQEHCLRGLEVSSLEEFGKVLREFTDRYNSRIHSSLGESPDERFKREKEHLRDLPEVEPRELFSRESRQVSNEGYINWDGNLYPVPMKYCLQEVMVESVYGVRIRVYAKGGELILDEEVELFEKGRKPIHPEHEAINEGCKERLRKIRSARVKRFIEVFGDTGKRFYEGLKRTAGQNVYWHLDEILSYCSLYETEDIAKALLECLEAGSFHKDSILRILKKVPLRQHTYNVQELVFPSSDIKRPLDVYAGLKEVTAQ